jgi:hypothetical protein
MHLSNASAMLPQHCLAVAPHLKDARDGLDENGSLKFLQLLSALCLLPAFVSQAQCSGAGLSASAHCPMSSLSLTQLLQRYRSCCPFTRTKTQSSAKPLLPSPLWPYKASLTLPLQRVTQTRHSPSSVHPTHLHTPYFTSVTLCVLKGDCTLLIINQVCSAPSLGLSDALVLIVDVIAGSQVDCREGDADVSVAGAARRCATVSAGYDQEHTSAAAGTDSCSASCPVSTHASLRLCRAASAPCCNR